MRCTEVREYLLQADPAELMSDAPVRIAEHVRSCARCASERSRLLAAHRRLEDAVGRLRPRLPLSEVLAGFEPTRAVQVITAPGSAAPGSRLRLQWASAVAAVAAAIVLLLTDPVAGDSSGELAGVTDTTRIPIQVDVPADRNAIVFETKNPLITVVWLYKQEGD